MISVFQLEKFLARTALLDVASVFRNTVLRPDVGRFPAV